MKVTKEKIENSQAYLTVEMEAAEMEAGMEDGYKHLVTQVNVPGFRKGKAPRAMLERAVGKGRLIEEAIEHIIPKAYQNACKEQSIEPYAQPSVEITQSEPLIFKAVVPLAPTVELNDYKSIRMTQEPVEVKDSDVDAVIEQLRHQHATWEPVERPLAMNDLAVIDINAMVEEKPYVRKAAAQYQLNEANITPAPKFSETIVGMKKEEEKEFDLPFPPEYPSKELAGKTAHFKVKLHEIKEEKLPELNDEFPKQISTDIKTLEALKEEAKKNLKQRLEDQSRMDFEEKVVNAAIEKANVCFPPILIDIEINRVINEQASQLQMSGKGMEEYLRSINKTPEQLQEDLRPVATKNVTASLLLEKLAEVEKVEVTEFDIDARLDNMVLGIDQEKKTEMRRLFDNPQTRGSVRQQLMARKTIQTLADIAKGEADKGAKEEEKK